MERKKEPLNFQIALRKSHKSWPDDEMNGEKIGEKEMEKGRVKNEEKLDGMRIKKFVPLTLKMFVL